MFKDMCFRTIYFPSFQTVADYNLKTIVQLPEGKIWKAIQPGLNLEGICKNKACIAFDKKVWAPLGFGNFQVAKLVNTTRCVVCSKCLKSVSQVGIFLCNLIGIGAKGSQTDSEKDKDEEFQESSFQFLSLSSQNMIKFGDFEKQIIQWHYLDLKVSKIKSSQEHPPKSFQLMNQNWTCSKCKNNFHQVRGPKDAQIEKKIYTLGVFE